MQRIIIDYTNLPPNLSLPELADAIQEKIMSATWDLACARLTKCFSDDKGYVNPEIGHAKALKLLRPVTISHSPTDIVITYLQDEDTFVKYILDHD